jgi:hypothetical protein
MGLNWLPPIAVLSFVANAIYELPHVTHPANMTLLLHAAVLPIVKPIQPVFKNIFYLADNLCRPVAFE